MGIYLYHEIVNKLGFIDQANARKIGVVVSFEPRQKAFTKININWAGRINPCFPGPNPMVLMVAAIAFLKRITDLINAVYISKGDVFFSDPRIFFASF